MARQSGDSQRAGVLNFLRTGGVKMPADLKTRRMAAAQRSIKERVAQTKGIGAEGAKLWGALQGASAPVGDDPASTRRWMVCWRCTRKWRARKWWRLESPPRLEACSQAPSRSKTHRRLTMRSPYRPSFSAIRW